MFKVRDRHTGKIKTVYGWNGTNFLIYDDGVWYYIPMEDYEPLEE